jgi:hypothetical protein
MVLKDYQKENLRATNFYKDSRGLGFKPAGRQATGRRQAGLNPCILDPLLMTY